MTKFNFAAVNKLFDTIAADATQHAFALMGSGVDGAGRNKGPIERMIKRLQDLEVAAANGLPYKDPIDTGKEASEKDTDAMNRARLLRIASAAARMNVQDAENELKGYAQADLRPRTRRAYGAAREALTTARQACDDLNKEAQADEFAATQMAGKEVEGSPGEHKEASEKAGDITQEDEEGAKRAVGQANRLLSDASTPMVAAAEALSGNWLAKMRAARGLQHIRDAMQSVARARSALQDYSYGNKEASEKWKPPTPEELLASYTTEAEDYIAKMARMERRIAAGQPANPSSLLQVTSAADSLRLSINKLSDPAAKELSKRVRDGIKSLLSASGSELKRGSVDGPYRAVYKDARPTLPSGRYADTGPWRLTGEE